MTAVSNAEELADLALTNPATAFVQAQTLLESSNDPRVRIPAMRAVGVARREQGDLSGAEEILQQACALAGETEPRLWAMCALTLGSVVAYQGRLPEAIGLFERCLEASQGLDRANAHFQLATGLFIQRRFDRALHHYSTALPVLRKHGRLDWVAHLLGNRGALFLEDGRYREAISDLDEAIALHTEAGGGAQLGWSQWNKAEALFLNGNIAESLRTYELAEATLVESGIDRNGLSANAYVLLAAGLFEEAVGRCRSAFAFHQSAGNAFEQLEALVPAAQAAFAMGDDQTVLNLAELAHQVPHAKEFPEWLDRLDVVSLRSSARSQLATAADLDRASALAKRLKTTGVVRGVEAGLAAAQTALILGYAASAKDELDNIASLHRRSPLHLQIEFWKLTTQIRMHGVDSRSPRRAMTAGLNAFRELVAVSPSYELRVNASRHATTLLECAVVLADEHQQWSALLPVVDAVRGHAVEQPSTKEVDGRLRTALDSLAAEEADLRQGRSSGAKILGLQRNVSKLSRTPSSPPTSVATRPGRATDESMLTFVCRDEQLIALEQDSSGIRARQCGDVSDIRAIIADQLFAFRQLARRSRLQESNVVALEEQLRAASSELSERLLGQLSAKRLVVSPDPQIADLAWGALPALAATPHVIAPSALLSHRPLKLPTKYVLVMGSSEPSHVPLECEAVANVHNGVAIIEPTAEQFTKLGGVDLAHLAGHFIKDGGNPLFSAIQFQEAVLNGHHVLALANAPKIAVLSACTSGAIESVGPATTGFANALLAAGTASVVVSQAPLEDGETLVSIMVELHRLLREHPPADALCQLRMQADDRRLSIVQSLVVVGTGW